MQLIFFILGMLAIVGGFFILLGTGPLDRLMHIIEPGTTHKTVPPPKDIKTKIAGIIVLAAGIFIVIFRLP